ncbi:hypothetical protein [Streptomyces sp. NPDC001404]|uniref:hypothetical protein n=1 Tax=Streptomyces sp. NPDC001404 TaxID=3364571 RepID=UPI0036BEE493
MTKTTRTLLTLGCTAAAAVGLSLAAGEATASAAPAPTDAVTANVHLGPLAVDVNSRTTVHLQAGLHITG